MVSMLCYYYGDNGEGGRGEELNGETGGEVTHLSFWCLYLGCWHLFFPHFDDATMHIVLFVVCLFSRMLFPEVSNLGWMYS